MRTIDNGIYDRIHAEWWSDDSFMALLRNAVNPPRFDYFRRELLNRFGGAAEKSSVLDVGCSTGAFLFQLKRRFPNDYQTLGLDVSGPALDYAAQQGVPILKEPYLTADFGPHRFRAVTFWAVIEHLAHPRDGARRAVDEQRLREGESAT